MDKSSRYQVKRELFRLLVMEHFMNSLSSNVRYEIVKCEMKDVVEEGRKADQFWATFGSYRNETSLGEGSKIFPGLRKGTVLDTVKRCIQSV